MLNDDGTLSHGEMAAGSGRIMLGSVPDYENPRNQRAHSARARAWGATPWVVDGVLVYVDDVAAHCANARAAGATILSEIEHTWPATRYRAEDPEGHRWMFMERARV
jgi:uncharacterized glyoxalase superfamily protein PhnB